MAVSRCQPPEGAEDLGQTVADLGAVGCGFSDLGSLLTCNSEGRPDLWRRDMDHDPVYWAAAGRILSQCGVVDIEETAMALVRRDLGIPPRWRMLCGR